MLAVVSLGCVELFKRSGYAVVIILIGDENGYSFPSIHKCLSLMVFLIVVSKEDPK